MKKHLFICLLVGLSCLPASPPLYGQTDVLSACGLSGRILSDNAQPLPGANIWLVHSKDTLNKHHVSSRNDGSFQATVPPGTYQLRVSYIGFTPHQARVDIRKDMQLPDIFLAEDKHQLSTVTVTARTVTYNAEGYIAHIAQNAQLKQMPLDRILSFLPGMYADREKIKVYMKDVSNVYLNDRPVQLGGKDLMDYLRAYDGKNIQKIEVIANNGVEHAATGMGSASIRITTVKIVEGGLVSASADARYSGSNEQYGNPFGNFMWRKGKLSVNLNASAKTYFVTKNESYTETEYLSSGLKTATENYSVNDLPRYTPVRFGLGFDLTDKDLFTVSGTYTTRLANQQTETRTRQHPTEGTPVSSLSQWYKDNGYESISTSAEYLRRLENGRLSISTSWGTSDSESKQERNSEQDGQPRQQGLTLGDGHSRSWGLNMDYNNLYKGGKERLKFGASYNYWANQAHTDAQQSTGGTADAFGTYQDRYHYRENNYALYASYDKNWGCWNLQVGVRLEHLRISPTSQINPERNHKSHYTNLFPSVMLNYTIHADKGHNLNLSYTRSMNAPDMPDLNPALIWENEYTYRTGNPYLEPTFGHTAGMRFNLFNNYIVGAQFAHSKLRTDIYSQKEGTELVEISPQNIGKSQDLSIYIAANILSIKNLMANLNLTYAYGRQSYMGQSVSSSAYAITGSFDYRLPKDYNLSTLLVYNSKTKGVQETVPDWYTFDISLYKSFFENWEFGVSYFYNSNTTKDIQAPDIQQHSWNNQKRYTVSFRVSYSFRWGEWIKIRRASGGDALGRDGIK